MVKQRLLGFSLFLFILFPLVILPVLSGCEKEKEDELKTTEKFDSNSVIDYYESNCMICVKETRTTYRPRDIKDKVKLDTTLSCIDISKEVEEIDRGTTTDGRLYVVRQKTECVYLTYEYVEELLE